MATDNYSNFDVGLESPAVSGVAVTPSDTADLTLTTRAVFVGGGGAIRVILARDTSAVTFSGVAAGTLLPIRVSRVLATGTTATSILALN